MPIYEYRCDACGHLLDALQKISDEPLKTCPECDAKALRRLMSAPSFRLKGGGWYETDFKSDKERKRNLADGIDGAKVAEKSDTAKAPDKEASKKPDKKESADSGGGKAGGGKDSSSAVA